MKKAADGPSGTKLARANEGPPGPSAAILAYFRSIFGSVRLGRIVKGRHKIRPHNKKKCIIWPNEKKCRILKGITGQKAKYKGRKIWKYNLK